MRCVRAVVWLSWPLAAWLAVACVNWHGGSDAGPDGRADGATDGSAADGDGAAADDGQAGPDADGSPDGDGAVDGDGGSCIDAYPGQVILTEIMVQPQAVAPADGCYFELYNAGFETLQLTGWEIEDAAGRRAAVGLPAADFAPAEHIVIGFAADPDANGGFEPALVVAGVDLSGGRLRLWAGDILVDEVDYSGPDWPDPQGAALSLDPEGHDGQLNDQPAWWCAAWVGFGAGDLGSPGAANPECEGTPECGNGVREAGEQCDDGNDDPCDGCLPNCTLHENFCGDGWTCGDEECDDGNADPCDGCLGDCTLHENFCGDGIRCPPEECDDGNNDDGDRCSADCRAEASERPAEMVRVAADPELGVAQDFCMDRYEASRPDATAEAMGSDISLATSRAGVLPWFENPMDGDKFALFQAACAAAGKRLCSKQEWYAVCTGPERWDYTFGDTFDPETCNCVDSFCDDYCRDNGIADCNTDANCGYDYYCFHAAPTGQFSNCISPAGAYDVCGNVWEVVPSASDDRGFEVRGGAFNCAGASSRLLCTYNASWSALYAGFRCCKDLSQADTPTR